MPKKENIREFENECPICGGMIWKRVQVIIEGAKISVCQSCSQHGKKVIANQLKRKSFPQKQAYDAKYRKKSRKPYYLESLEELVSDFNIRIRKRRNQLKLTQEEFAQKLNEKPSLIRRIETGKTKPTIELAKKIENVYKIELLEESSEMNERSINNKYLKKKSGTSLGDIAFIKKRD